jgi:type IV secretory pathway TraG/TraD family ATPase VirD4
MKNLVHNTLGKSFIIYLGIVPLIYLFSLITENSETIKTVRGAELISLTAYFFELEKANIKTDVCIGKTITKSFFKKKLKPVYLPELAGHILLIGSTGTGKTNSILQMLEWYETENIPCIILDAKNEYIAKKFRPGVDLIFNPLDCDSIQWNFFDEIKRWPDIDAISAFIVPDNKSHSDPIWTHAPRGIIAALIEHLIKINHANCGSLWDVLNSGISTIRKALRHSNNTTISDYLTETGNTESHSKLAQDIKASMTQYIQFLRYMPKKSGDFTIDDWLKNKVSGNIYIYITSHPDLKETLKPALSLFLSMLIMKVNALPDDQTRKIRWILDEINQLYPQKLLPDLLTQSRSKGSQVIIGIQDKAQFDENYGKNNADSIIGCCATQIIFRCDGPETAEYASKILSKGKIIEPENSSSHGSSDVREGISKSNRPKEEYLLMASEIQMSPDLKAYVFPKARNPFGVDFAYKHFSDQIDSFVARPDLKLCARCAHN